MKWFKHFTNAHNDNALKKIRMKYGADGYAIYWYCLELIAGDLDQAKATFELSHDAEVIGYDLKIDQLRVEEIMKYMVSLKLFEEQNSTVTCLKLAKFLDKKNTRNPEIHAIIDSISVADSRGQLPDSPRMSPPDKNRLDKKDNNGDKSPDYTPEFEQFWKGYPSANKGNKQNAFKAWNKLSTENQNHAETEAGNFFQLQKKSNKDYFLHCSTYLNNKRWKDIEDMGNVVSIDDDYDYMVGGI